MDNIVDKGFQAPRKPRIHAVFIKMPTFEAKIKPSQINHLQASTFCSTRPDEAYSYKFLQQGISRQSVVLQSIYGT